MIKLLTFVAVVLVGTMKMNAQEICIFNSGNSMNLDSEYGTALTAGTILGETSRIVAKIGADDIYKPQSATFSVNGIEIAGGLQGATNPKDEDGGVPANTLNQPTSGAFLQFEVKTNGFLYIMFRASSNKAYTVFKEGTPISYTFAAIGDASTLLGSVYSFMLPYVLFESNVSVEWAEQEYLKATYPDIYAANWKEVTSEDGTTQKIWDPAIKVNGLGVLKFPVSADCKYIVNANRSKIIAVGFAFNTEDNLTISANGIKIVGPGDSPAIAKRCAKPEISYANGKISFSSETEGVQFVSEITASDAKKYDESTVSLNQTYKVSVYATKQGYVNSETATREIVITGNGKAIVVGDVDGDGKVNVADHVELTKIIMGQ